jgi:triosephosphate isomerase
MKAIVIANWKMEPVAFKEARKLLEGTKKVAEKSGVPVIVAPPAIFLRELSAASRGKRVGFAAQNAHYERGGAHTGDISLAQLKEARVSHVIIGHAERRAAGETNDDTRKKVAATLEARMTPVLCVGELKRAGTGEHFPYVREQLQAGFADVPQEKVKQVVVVYEPLWAIGTDKPVSPRAVHEMAIFIRKTIVDAKGDVGMSVKILYGGSVTEVTAADMLRLGDVEGLLVGRASLEPERFGLLLAAVKSA